MIIMNFNPAWYDTFCIITSFMLLVLALHACIDPWSKILLMTSASLSILHRTYRLNNNENSYFYFLDVFFAAVLITHILIIDTYIILFPAMLMILAWFLSATKLNIESLIVHMAAHMSAVMILVRL